MSDKNLDEELKKSLISIGAKRKLIKDDGSIDVPGTPLIIPGRGTTPKDDEYVDSSTDLGITKDINKIEELKIKHQRDTIENALLGKFDDKGIYSVSEEISKELIEMVKTISLVPQENNAENNYLETADGKVKMLPGVIFVETVSQFGGVGKFKFAIQTYYNGAETSSELFLLEDVKKAEGLAQDVNIYSVGKYTETFGTEYKMHMFAYFNIVSKELANKMNDEEQVLFGWAYRRKMYLKTLAQLGSGKYQLAEADYLNAKIEALASLGAYGASVLSMFNDLQERAKLILGKELTARDLNDLLDIIIDDMASKYPEMTKIYHSTIHGATVEYIKAIKAETEANKQAAQEKAKAKVKSDYNGFKDAKPYKIASSKPVKFDAGGSKKKENKSGGKGGGASKGKTPAKVAVPKPKKDEKKEENTKPRKDLGNIANEVNSEKNRDLLGSNDKNFRQLKGSRNKIQQISN